MHSDISIVASHIGTLDVQRVNVKDVLFEPNPKMVNGGRIQKMEGLSVVHAWTGDDVKPVQDCNLTNTDFVSNLGKSCSITLIFSIQCLFKYLCIYVARSCMKS